MQDLKDRELHQSEGFPKKLPPPLTPVLGPGALLRGPARLATEHAQRLDCCVSLPASRSAWELAAGEGLPRREGVKTPNRPEMG